MSYAQADFCFFVEKLTCIFLQKKKFFYVTLRYIFHLYMVFTIHILNMLKRPYKIIVVMMIVKTR